MSIPSILKKKVVWPHQTFLSNLWFLIKLSRPIFWLAFILPFIGAVIIGGSHHIYYALTYILLIIFPLMLITFGINDMYDYPSDKRNSRKKDVEGLILHPKYHPVILLSALIALLVVLLVALIFTILLNEYFIIVFTVGFLFLALAYSMPPLRFKDIPIIDSLSNGLAVLILMVLGFVFEKSLLEFPTKALFIAVAVAGAHALTTIPDYTADKRAGITTFATVFGKKIAASFAFITFALAFFYSGIRTPLLKGYIIIAMIITLLVFFYPEEKFALRMCKLLFILFMLCSILFLFF